MILMAVTVRLKELMEELYGMPIPNKYFINFEHSKQDLNNHLEKRIDLKKKKIKMRVQLAEQSTPTLSVWDFK